MFDSVGGNPGAWISIHSPSTFYPHQELNIYTSPARPPARPLARVPARVPAVAVVPGLLTLTSRWYGPTRATGCGTSSFGNIFFTLAALSWMCVGIHRRRMLPSPVCGLNPAGMVLI